MISFIYKRVKVINILSLANLSLLLKLPLFIKDIFIPFKNHSKTQIKYFYI